MDLKEFGIWLTKLREQQGYTSQRQLYLASGVSNSTISRMEAGTQKPEPETLKKLAPFLGVSYEHLLKQAGYLSNGQINSSIIYENSSKIDYVFEIPNITYKGKPISEEKKKKVLEILEQPEIDEDARFARELVANMESEYGKKPSNQLIEKLTNIHKRLKQEARENKNKTKK